MDITFKDYERIIAEVFPDALIERHEKVEQLFDVLSVAVSPRTVILLKWWRNTPNSVVLTKTVVYLDGTCQSNNLFRGELPVDEQKQDIIDESFVKYLLKNHTNIG